MSITRNSTFSNFAKKIKRDPPYNLFMISKVQETVQNETNQFEMGENGRK